MMVRGSVADFYLFNAEQDRQNTVADILYVRRALHRKVVACCREHINEHLANLFNRRFGALVCLDEIFDLAAHKRVADNGDVADQNLGLLFAG